MNHELQAFQVRSHLHFQDQSLLLRALTHPSFLNENPHLGLEDNERLEFLGDAVLDFVSGEWLYHRLPEAAEGRLTRLRAVLVRTETLASFATSCHIGEALLLGHGELENGGRKRMGNLCAAFEAVVGALYLDQGIQAVRDFVEPMFVPALERALIEESDKDAKSLLQEWSQAHHSITPTYRTIASRGPDHDKEFIVAVYIGDKQYGEGAGPNKQSAAQEAAQQALDKINKGNLP